MNPFCQMGKKKILVCCCRVLVVCVCVCVCVPWYDKGGKSLVQQSGGPCHEFPSGPLSVSSMSSCLLGELRSLVYSFFKFIFRERGGTERNIDRLPPNWGPSPQPRHVPRPGIEQAGLQSQGATPVRAVLCILSNHFLYNCVVGWGALEYSFMLIPYVFLFPNKLSSVIYAFYFLL